MGKVLMALAAALVAGIAAAPALADHAWNGYHWARTANPFTVALGDNVTPEWDAYLSQAAADWSADTAGSPVNAAIAPGQSQGNCRPTAGRVEVCDSRYGNTGWLGVAQISLSNGHISQGTVKVNDTYYETPTYNTPIWRAVVMCQEIGHTLGLDHQDESGADLHTCMDYASTPDADNTHPNQHDYEELAVIYAHLDSFTTIGAATPRGQAARQGAKPYRVSRRDSRRLTRIVERFADGSQKVTLITWA